MDAVPFPTVEVLGASKESALAAMMNSLGPANGEVPLWVQNEAHVSELGVVDLGEGLGQPKIAVKGGDTLQGASVIHYPLTLILTKFTFPGLVVGVNILFGRKSLQTCSRQRRREVESWPGKS